MRSFALLSLLSLASAQSLPSILVTLTPNFSSANNSIISLNLTLLLNDPTSLASRPILRLALNNGATHTLEYPTSALVANDAKGPLPLTSSDTNTTATDFERRWFPSREPTYPVTVKVVATPPDTGPENRSGPRIDIRRDAGGVVGMGAGFIPSPPAEEDWNVTIRWNIRSDAPPNTRFASSLGDSIEESDIGRPSTVLSKSLFAAGPLRRWPDWNAEATINGTSERQFAMYWLDPLPYTPANIAPTTRSIFLSVSSYFNDTTSSFRVFWRRAYRGYGGTGGHNSFIMEHSGPATAEEQSADTLQQLLAHETVHEYALMYPKRQEDLWYREGVAQYVAAFAPRNGGGVDDLWTQRWMSNYAQAYYTGSTTNRTWEWVVANYWTVGTDVVKSPYSRGFIYLAYVQGLIYEVTEGKRSLDEVILELYRRYKAGDKVQTEEFLDVVGGIVGKDKALASWELFASGKKLMVPHPDAFIQYNMRMVRRDAERLELGFNEGSLGANRIIGLAPGSRAEAAGLREGDQIASSYLYWIAGDSMENFMQVTVVRDGVENVIRWWPRSYDRMENWVWVRWTMCGFQLC